MIKIKYYYSCSAYFIVGVIGADVKGFRLPCEDQPITSRMAMICGTSTCHMAVSDLQVQLICWVTFKTIIIK